MSTYRPNVVLLMAGANDLIQNNSVSTAPSRLSALMDQIIANDPGVTVLVGNLIQSLNANVVADGPAFNAALPAIIQAKQAAGQHVALADMYDAIPTSDLGPDAIHPTDTGYQLMANTWNTAIQTASAAGWFSAPTGMAASGEGSGEVQAGIAGDCLDVNGGDNADGTAVQLWTCNHTAAQTWTVYTDDTLRALGKCLDATAGATGDGTKVRLYTCNGTEAQQWDLRSGMMQASGLCLDVAGNGTADGTLVDLWDCSETANQVWVPQANGSLLNPQSGKCLDDPGLSTTDGTQLDIWDCNGGANQVWTLA